LKIENFRESALFSFSFALSSLSHDQGISMATGSSEVQFAEVGVWVGVS